MVAKTAYLRIVSLAPSTTETSEWRMACEAITGRYTPRALIETADLVTEMKECKPYFRKGIQAGWGIEK
jgi:ATP:corrinoid adenosyltransferase